MIIRGWSIDGYGLFHQEECRGLGDGLTVVLGPNESGKSTLMAFVRGVLFGFPDRRSRDPHHLPLQGGRHGGRLFLDTPAGPVTVEREAGRFRPPLLTLPDGGQGGAEQLDEILGGLDLEAFRSVFAFGLTELNDFAALDAGGIGQRLFSAGITGAGRSAREVLDILDDRAARLLRPRGRSAIGTTLEHLTGLEDRIAAARSELGQHPGLVREEEDQCRELETQSREADRLRAKQNRLERLLELWPSWNQRQQAARRLALLPAGEDDQDPGDRLSRLADRLEDEAGQDAGTVEDSRETGAVPVIVVPLLVILAATAMGGMVWRLRAGDWPLASILALGAAAAALAALAVGRRRFRHRRRLEEERQRRAADTAANLAAAPRDLDRLRRSLSGTAERQSLEQTVRQVDSLVAARAGVDHEATAFIEELGSGSVDRWEQALDQTRQDLAGAVERRDQALKKTETVRRQREALELSTDLPALETEAEALGCRLEEETGQWRLLVTARGLVEEAMREFVAGRQPAVLAQASRLFSTVSMGRYRQVVQEPDGNTLTLLTVNGERVGTGDLSRGTAEQLYLCLRLALAGDHAGRGSPLPLLMDDVLVNADPERAAGLAAAIGEYARRGQVLLFTCHPRTAELLENLEGEVDIRMLADPPAGKIYSS